MGRIPDSDTRDAGTNSRLSAFISGDDPQSVSLGSHRSEDNRDSRYDGCEGSFEAFAGELRQELAPRSLLERVLADRVVLSAWAMHTAGLKERAAIRARSVLDTREESELLLQRPSSRGRVGTSPRGVLLVAHCLGKTVDLLLRLREGGQPRWGRPGPLESNVSPGEASHAEFDAADDVDLDPDNLSDLSDEWPITPRGRSVAFDPDDEAPTGERALSRRWQDRLVFDVNVSEHSPVIKGTWVTVGHVVSLIVDGWTWSDILRTHPELNVDDIRTCLAYTVAEGNGET